MGMKRRPHTTFLDEAERKIKGNFKGMTGAHHATEESCNHLQWRQMDGGVLVVDEKQDNNITLLQSPGYPGRP